MISNPIKVTKKNFMKKIKILKLLEYLCRDLDMLIKF